MPLGPRPAQLGPDSSNGDVGVGVGLGGRGVGVEVVVGVTVGVNATQNPEVPEQFALNTGMQPPPQVPAIGGPQDGRPHWQQSLSPGVGVGVEVGVRVGVGVSVMQRPPLVAPPHTAPNTGAQPDEQVPPTTGPHAGKGH